MLKSIFVLVVFFAFNGWVQAQGKVHFNEPSNVSTIFSNYVIKSRTETTIRGWRIQIVSTDDRREMENTKSKFSSLYPGVPSAWKHVSPYFHIRVGAYRTKTEMMSFLATLKKDFPAAIPVQDDIKKYDLISY